jgi:hypothetical protein
VYRDRPRTLNELQTTVTAYVRNISQADLEIVFANKIKRVQACIDARGHHFQHRLQVHSYFPNSLYFLVYSNAYDTFLLLAQIDGIWEQNFALNIWT